MPWSCRCLGGSKGGEYAEGGGGEGEGEGDEDEGEDEGEGEGEGTTQSVNNTTAGDASGAINFSAKRASRSRDEM